MIVLPLIVVAIPSVVADGGEMIAALIVMAVERIDIG
jgi:hypothetical protein